MTKSTYRYENGRLMPRSCGVVEEFPVRLTVNGRPLATLVASPHQLNFLIAGFLRLQGFAETLDDILSLGVCSDFGYAEVRLQNDVPENLAPTLTSGCGTGISFNLDMERLPSVQIDSRGFVADDVFRLMRELAERTERYRNHGGIHSAAVGDQNGLLLSAEDIGRHNTLDRIAGEALFKEIDLRGKMLVTSGRVSTEMVAKAARLGIALIASRTSPTDMAIRMAAEAGIVLIGYLRGEHFEVYSHPEKVLASLPIGKVAGVTGVILAGGESRRMGCDKSLLPVQGARFIDHIHQTLSEVFDEVLLVTNSPELYAEIPCRKVPDIYHAQGALAGIHSGLAHARSEQIFVVACDMPFVSATAIRSLCAMADEGDVVIPRSERGSEPLHALYSKRCLPAMERVLDAGRKRIVHFFPDVAVQEVAPEQVAWIDPGGRSFLNINTPEEYYALRGKKPVLMEEDARRKAALAV